MKTTYDDKNIGLKITPQIGSDEVDVQIEKKSDAEWPVQFYTSSTDVKDWVGNVTKIEGGKCSVRGVYRGSMCELTNIRICDDSIKNGARVMVTEHLGIDGKMGFIATKRRVLLGGSGSALNFVNIGWSDEKKCRYVRFDVYTGESTVLECGPVYSLYKAG